MKSRYRALIICWLVIQYASALFADNDSRPTLLVPINRDVMDFVRVADTLAGAPRPRFSINGRILRAAMLFDALSAYGIKVTSGRRDLFRRVAGTDSMYLIPPLQVFNEHKGTAAELAVLYASILEASGIATALLNVKDHPLVMFDTGVNKRYASSITNNPDAYVIRNNQVWFAVEVTKIGRHFYDAWENTYGKVTINPLDLIPVIETFESNFHELAETFRDGVDSEKLNSFIWRDLDYFEGPGREGELTRVTSDMQDDRRDAAIHFQEGMRLLEAGDDQQAILAFKEAIEYGADLGHALFLIADAYGKRQYFEKMLQSGRKLIQFNRRDSRGYKIVGLAYYYAGDLSSSERFFVRAKFLENNLIPFEDQTTLSAGDSTLTPTMPTAVDNAQ